MVFDVGGTKIASTVINDKGVDLLLGRPHVVETQEHAPAEEFVGLMATQLRELSDEFGEVVAWSAAFPGPYRRLPNGELQVFPRNVPGVRGKSIEEEMRKFVPDVPGVIDNDTKLATWGEYLIGALRGTADGVGVVHGTGVSSAVISEGKLLRGPDNNAGEMGCIVVETDPDKAFPCDAQEGKALGHLEAQVRGPALASHFFGVDRSDKAAVHQALTHATPEKKTEMIEWCTHYMALAFTPLLQAFSTGNIVFFGGVATLFGEEYADSLTQAFCASSEAFRDSDQRVHIAQQPIMAPLVAAAQEAFAKVGIDMSLDMYS